MFVILLRHAEREPSGSDPALSAAGRRRAQLLAAMLNQSTIDAIFTSEFRRTKETAAPIAQLLHLSPVELSTSRSTAQQQIRQAGQCVLVVGHSDTVPALIGALNGPQNVALDDHDFGSFFVLHVEGPNSRLLPMRYGDA